MFALAALWQPGVAESVAYSAAVVPGQRETRSAGGGGGIGRLLARAGRQLLNSEFVCWLLEQIPPLRRFVNRRLIDATVRQVRARPHPFSTVHNFVSWKGLTDQTWSARHLPATPIAGDALPRREDLLEIFKRPDGQARICRKSTCLFPTFAQYLTDGFIRTMTDRSDPDFLKKNTSNHNIDLCPLYGRTEAQTRALRVSAPAPADRGKLKSQRIGDEAFSPFLYKNGKVAEEFEVLDPPLGVEDILDACRHEDPAVREAAIQRRDALFALGGDRANSVPQVAMLNTLFLREHNRLAGVLGQREPDWSDDRVFETARNIVIVLFIKIVVEEYINHIAPLRFLIKADPKAAWNAKWNRPNWITTEFSLLYRWHALVPDRITWGDTEYPVRATFMNNIPLISGGLAQGFTDMSRQPAGELGPMNTTDGLLHVEQASIDQGRVCELAPFSDYLEYLGRPRLKSAAEVSSRPEVRKLLERLYGRPDRIEFFVGLFAEDRVKNSPLPQTVLSLVAVDAFSQALTNPLLSEHVFNEGTFTPYGMQQIAETASLADILRRNVPNPDGLGPITMTRPDWQRE